MAIGYLKRNLWSIIIILEAKQLTDLYEQLSLIKGCSIVSIRRDFGYVILGSYHKPMMKKYFV